MRCLVPLLAALAALAAGCGGGGTSAADLYAQQQVVACTKVQKTLAAIPQPSSTATTKKARERAQREFDQYVLKIDRALIRGMSTLRSAKAPKKLAALQEQWLAAVRAELRARLALDTAPAARLARASRVELRARKHANALAGKLGIASGCNLLAPY